MKGLLLNVFLNDDNISGYINSFKYEDDIEKDDLVIFDTKPEFSLLFANRSDVNIGTKITFQYGYIGGAISQTRLAIITDIEMKYDQNSISMIIKCLDKGNFLKKNSKLKIWKNKTASQIATEIAKLYELETNIESTSFIYKSLPQGALSDFDLLRYLAKREINYIFYIKDNILCFKKRDFSKNSLLTFTYGLSNVISFEPKHKLSSKTGAFNSTQINTTTDNIPDKSVVNNKNASTQSTLGKYNIDVNGNESYIANTNKIIVNKTDSNIESTKIADATKKNNELNTHEALLRIEGNPSIKTDSIITISGVANRHLGNWYVVNVTHNINNSGYITTLGLKRNGSGLGSKNQAKSKTTNDSIGDSKITIKNKLNNKKIDQNGNIYE